MAQCYRIFRSLLIWASMLAGVGASSAWAEEFLPPEQAFAFTASAINDSTVRLHWTIAPGYHLYRDRISVQADAPNVTWQALMIPAGTEEFDTNFSKMVAVFRNTLDVDVKMTQGNAAIPLTVGWQGCADSGLCYQPDSQQLQVALTGMGAGKNGIQLASVGATEDTAAPITPSGVTATASVALNASKIPVALSIKTQQAPDSIAQTLASGSLMQTLGAFLLAGLLLAFTPCVLPMVPILSSLIAGQTGPVSRGKGFGLSLAYAFGMALVYAGFGVAAGLAGEGLAAALQNPWVLGAFALLLSTLAMSMFGFYELQMPSFIQSRATEWSNSFKGGSFVGVFIMGGVSALVVGPCVAAPLAGALVYISQTRDVVLGGLALFSMALGMSVPLLLVGLSAGSLLPRAGAWMERVKQVFGMMLLGVAIWMVSPVIPTAAHMLLWAIWLLTAAALLGVFGAATPQHARTPVAARASGAGFTAVALVLLIGAASGGQSVLQPLSHLGLAQAGNLPGAIAHAGLKFERVANVQALNAALTQAKQHGQTVMLDFYADWCVSCKEYETFTFSDSSVQKRLNGVKLLQVDVTANSVDDKALLKRFGLFGPPGIVFFDGEDNAQVIHKVIGYQAPKDFLASLGTAQIL
ncbi:MAG: protein-disulfide reductase DsbD [Rhodoferax sp.]|uniref:protein-disulfide reductase DsbD n=1 Tax=Rhodoferax sp. TaxID=50421 RepID=UPI00262EAFF4|nr:protein-disulfide reductase DsbD [Rhodoferax sp.]MDD2880052.1 protein-disulfide reductase DsbD [Rhodoferax sp.]